MSSSQHDLNSGFEPVSIERVSGKSDDFYQALTSLLPQLSSSAKLPSLERFETIVNDPNIVILVARSEPPEGYSTSSEKNPEPSAIVGMITVSYLNLLTGKVALVEDVVVDTSWRGRGVGKLLIQAAIGHCRQNNVKHIDLTSRPQRVSANKLYEKMGFSRRETNVWRYTNDEYRPNDIY
ncbi:MAG: GNAT family N-acetyltransferase [Firmicutes bacterium]|nr:GNAT family N-acetyltransferase [Bacillota bacterium]